ncbi:unnamed protein product, partial [Musa hybrid cultivar]
ASLELSPELDVEHLLQLGKDGLVRHRPAALLRQLRLAHLLRQPRPLDRVPHLHPHPFQRRRLRRLVQLPRVHRRPRSLLVRPRLELLHRLHRRPGADGLVHGLGVLELDGPGLAPAQHHRLPVLRQNLPVPSLVANEWLMAD